jgi:hypothetical protein
LLPIAVAGCGLLLLLAWLSARTTVYAITTQRVVMRIGIALPLVVNLPFAGVRAAAMQRRRAGAGDIPLQLDPDTRLAYLNLWPHARPWHVRSPEPMLRSVPDVAQVAATLARAVSARLDIVQPIRPDPATARRPAEAAAEPVGLAA